MVPPASKKMKESGENNFLFWAFPKNKEVDLLLAALKTLQPAKVVSPVSLT